MTRYVFQFSSAALSGEEETFNRWYEDVHMPDVLKQSGFLSAQRYTVIDATSARTRYVAAYEVECDDPQAVLGKLFEDGKNMVISPALDMAAVNVTILKPGFAIGKKPG